MPNTLTINERFNGPPQSGNGGYSCGILAAYVNGPAKVRLYAPPPLNKPLTVSTSSTSAAMHDGNILVGKAQYCDFELDIPHPPSLDEAKAASEKFACKENHIYPTCFVCGPDRKCDDALCLFPGPVRDWNMLACSWQPNEGLLRTDGTIKDEYVWAALDCPGYFAAAGENLRVTLLGELKVNILNPVAGDKELIVYSWPIGEDGRKLYGGVAIATQTGEIVAYSHTTWIELK